jgi:hypothetical protein
VTDTPSWAAPGDDSGFGPGPGSGSGSGFDPASGFGQPLAAPPPSGPRQGPLVALALAVLLLAAAGGVVAAVRVGDKDRDAVTVAAAGCAGPSVDAEAVPGVAKHGGGTIEYETSPPYAGEHNPLPLPASSRPVERGTTPFAVERAVHNLEHGYVVVWYDSDASQEDVDRVADEVRAARLQKVLMVPWDRGTFENTRFALSAWGHIRYCEQPDAESIAAFYSEHGGPNGDAPERNAF